MPPRSLSPTHTHARMPARILAGAVALSLAFALSGCGGVTNPNRSLYSVHQPVVETATHTLDLAAGAGGLPLPEQRRLASWIEALDLGYGDRVALDGDAPSDAVHSDVAALLSRRGLLLDTDVPLTAGELTPGFVRVVVSRARAFVPGCPDWSDSRAPSVGTRTTADYGCAVNANLAAMVADPTHLLEGAKGTGMTVVMSSNKAIQSYREQAATGARGLSQVSTEED